MFSLADIPDENTCRSILQQIVTSQRIDHCACGRLLVWKQHLDYGWCKLCRKKVRPKAKSLFFSSKLTYAQLFGLIGCWQHRHSPGSTATILNLSYPTVHRWYGRFRENLPQDPSSRKLSGVVEVDEAFFGKKRYGGQVIVAGAIERDPNPSAIPNADLMVNTGCTRRLKLQIIPDTEQDSLEKFLEDNVERGSLVVTDCHNGYHDIEWLGYPHETWNHSKGYFAGTNHIEQVWSAIKRYMRKLYGSIPTSDLQLILNEWEARHNQPELFSSPENYLRRIVPD